MSDRVEVFNLRDVDILVYEEDTQLAYDNEVTTFVLDETIGNHASSPTATAIITAIQDDGSTGILTLRSIAGTWANDDEIFSGATKRADANGGVTDYNLTSYLLYVQSAVLRDSQSLGQSTACGTSGKRSTVLGHDYKLSLTRFHAKKDEDFDLTIDNTKTYKIVLSITNEDDPSLTETHTCLHCRLNSRVLSMNTNVNEVSTEWFVGDLT